MDTQVPAVTPGWVRPVLGPERPPLGRWAPAPSHCPQPSLEPQKLRRAGPVSRTHRLRARDQRQPSVHEGAPGKAGTGGATLSCRGTHRALCRGRGWPRRGGTRDQPVGPGPRSRGKYCCANEHRARPTSLGADRGWHIPPPDANPHPPLPTPATYTQGHTQDSCGISTHTPRFLPQAGAWGSQPLCFFLPAAPIPTPLDSPLRKIWTPPWP